LLRKLISRSRERNFGEKERGSEREKVKERGREIVRQQSNILIGICFVCTPDMQFTLRNRN